MEKAVQNRLETKSRDNQFLEVLLHQFEFSPKQAEAILDTAKEIYELDRYDPDKQVEPGKIKRQVVSARAKHGPGLKTLAQVTVTLTRDNGKEDDKVRRYYGPSALRQVRICRLTEEALDQGGILSQEDLADILAVDVRTIRRDVRSLKDAGLIIKTRGIYHDIGPSVSHKVWIVSLYLQFKTYSEISRRTRHSPSSIKRYLSDFGRVAVCYRKQLAVDEIAHVVGISERLARDYIELYKSYNTPEYADRLQDMFTRFNPFSSAQKAEGKKGATRP